MSTPNRIKTGTVEPLNIFVLDKQGAPLTGLTDLYFRIRRFSDNFWFDFSDSTFKALGSVTTLNSAALTQVSATAAPGLYQLAGGFNFGAITNPTAGPTAEEHYSIVPLQTPGTNAQLPGPGEICEGGFVDYITADLATILADTNETQTKLPTNNIMGSSVKTDKDDEIDAILTDTADMQPKVDSMFGKLPDNNIMGSAVKTDKDDEIDAILADTAAMEPLVTANLDATITSRESEADAASRAATNQSEHDATQALVSALDDAPTIADAVWDEAIAGHLLAGSTGQRLGHLDADITTRSSHTPADVDTQLSGTHGAGDWQGDTAAEIADAVWDEPQADHLGVGTTGKSLDLASSSGTSPADIADAVWDEALAGHTGAGSTGERLTRLDVNVGTRAVAGDAMDLIAGAVNSNALDTTAVAEIADGVWDEDITGHVGGSSAGAYQAKLDATVSSRATPGAAMDLVPDAVDASALAASAVAEIADGVWDEALAGHAGAGSAGQAQARVDATVSSRAQPGDQMALTAPTRAAIVDEVWNELQADHLTAGTMGKSLDDAKAVGDPALIADAVWDEPLVGHTGAGSMGQYQSRTDVPTSTRAQPGDPMDLQANALDAAALATDAVAEIADGVWDEALAGHSGAGTAGAAQARVDVLVSSRAAPGAQMDLVNDAVDSGSLADSGRDKIVDQVWEEAIADHSGTAGSTAETLANVAAPPSAAAVADAVWDEALSGHVGAGSAGQAMGRVDVQVSTRAAPGAAMDLVNDAVDAASLATSAAQEIRNQILSDSTPFAGANIDAAISSRSSAAALATAQAGITAIDGRLPADPADESNQLAAHAATQAAIAGLNDLSASEVEDAVWDAPHASHLAAGSTGKALEDASATADPAAIADAVWDEAAGDHTAAGSMGEKQNAADASDQIAGTATPWPPAAGSLLDRLANKGVAQTYDQATDSLEAIRERIG